MSVIFNPEDHTYKTEEGVILDSVTQIITEHIPMENIKEEWLIRGTRIHQACELYDNNNLGRVSKEIQPYIDAYDSFVEKEKPEYSIIEKSFASWRGFAGTPDRVGIVRGSKMLIDLKSGMHYLRRYELQTEGYEILLKDNDIDIENRALLFLKNGKYKFEIIKTNKVEDARIFLGMLKINNWKQKGA